MMTSRSVTVEGNVASSAIVTGDNNYVIVYQRSVPTESEGLQVMPGAKNLGGYWSENRMIILYIAATIVGILLSSVVRLPLTDLLGSSSPLGLYPVSFAPVLLIFLTETLPAWAKKKQQSKLSAWGVTGSVSKPGYFRISPYEDSNQDRQAFARADQIHIQILDWLSNTNEPLLYLTIKDRSREAAI